MTQPSTTYNDSDFYTFTPINDSRLVVLSDVDAGLKFNLYGDTFNDEFVRLDNYKTIPFWQGTGTSMNLADRSSINITTSENHNVNQGAIIGVLFDRDAAMVCNEEPDVRAQYNADGNFTNYFYTYDCSYYNDFDENVIVYTWGDFTIAALTPTKAKGTNSGTAVTVTAADATNDTLYCKVTDDPIVIAPGSIVDTTGWTSMTSGTKKDNITAVADQYMTVIEIVTATNVIVGQTTYKLTSAEIK